MSPRPVRRWVVIAAVVALVLVLAPTAAPMPSAGASPGQTVRTSEVHAVRAPVPAPRTAVQRAPGVPGAPDQSWTAVFAEDFEGEFPGANWELATSTTDYDWDDRGCRAHDGGWSGLGHGGGDVGASLACGAPYPHDLSTWMIHGPFSLAGATEAEVAYWYWLETESDFDWLQVMLSVNGENFSGWQRSGVSNDWAEQTHSLANVPQLGNLLGQPAVWLAIRFSSDESTAAEGAFIDDIEVRARFGSGPRPTPPTTVPPTGPGRLYLPVLQRAWPKTESYGMVVGIVSDTAGNRLADVVVTAGGRAATTNEQGYFTLSPLSARSRQPVKFTRAGYVSTSRIVTVRVGDSTHVDATMAPIQSQSDIGGASGGTVGAPGGGTVTIPAGGLVDAGGRPYNGTARVALSTFDPTTDAGLRAFPGEFEGVTRSGERVPFVSYGYADVTVTDPDGRPLQLAAGRSASLTVPIPAGIQSSAPATIPLWYFNPVDGQWHEEGVGTRDGSRYVGAITHFSIWNYDVGYNRSYVQGRVMDCVTNTPIEGARVTIKGIRPRNCWTSGERSTKPDGSFPNDPFYTGIPVDADSECEIWASKGGLESPHRTFTSLGPGSLLYYGVICLDGPPRVQITLTWGQDPADIDAHLSVPLVGGGRTHVYYVNKSPGGADANLDTDDRTSYGPEIVSVGRLHDGVYRYSVHHFRGAGTLSSSGAVVNLVIAAPGPRAGIYRLTPPGGAVGANDQWLLWDLTVANGQVVNVTTLNGYRNGVDAQNDGAFAP